MHETVISRKIIEDAKLYGQVKAIWVAVGELAHIPAHELAPTLREMAAPWRVEIAETPAKVKCPCGFEGRPSILERGHDMCVYVCPTCERVPAVVDGDQIKITRVEVE